MKATVEVWKIDDPSHPYPWRFAVTYNGTRHSYTGITNKCETKEEAEQRAIERVGWLESSHYDAHYVPVNA